MKLSLSSSPQLITDRYAYLFVLIAIVSAILLAPRRADVQGDGVFYYAYLPSLWLDGDLDLSNQYEQYDKTWLQNSWTYLTANGRPQNRFPIGPAVLWSPFFLLGHSVTKLMGHGGAPPGYSVYDVAFVFAGTFVYALLGILILYRILKEYFCPVVAFLSVVGVWLGTFLLFYQTIEASYSHAHDFFMACLVVWAWLRWRREPERIRSSIKLGVLIGFAALVRWQSMGLLLLPGGDLLHFIYNRRQKGWETALLIAGSRLGLIASTAVGLFALIQFPVWRAVNGQAVARFGFQQDWNNPFFGNVLFSTRNGLLTWTPIAWVCVLGMVLLARREPWLSTVFLAFLLSQIYLSTVHDIWSGGDSYGARRLSNSLPMLAFGLGTILDLLSQRRVIKLSMAVLAALILWNLGLMADYYEGAQPRDRTFSFMEIVERRYRITGNPLSFPANWLFALRHGSSPALYDTVVGDYFFEFGTLGTGIEFGNPVYRPLLVNGWSAYEGSDALWAEGMHSRILLPLYLVEDYILVFQVYPFSDPKSRRDQSLELKVNGTSVGKQVLAADVGWLTVQFQIPRRVQVRGINELELRYAYAVSPLEQGLSLDPRKLSVRFRQLAIVRVIDFADPRYGPFLVEGWGGYEPGSDAVWAEGAVSRILLPLPAIKNYILVFQVYPMSDPKYGRVQTMELKVNGTSVGKQTVVRGGGWTTVQFAIPPRAQIGGLNVLELRYAYAVSPSELDLGKDPRKLSVRFRALEIHPQF